jgi:hypothetical protein
MKILLTILAVLAGLITLGWLGLKIKPQPFETYPFQTPPLSDFDTVPLPADLPAPVKRFYRTLYGDEIPVIETAVISGRASMRVGGITFPARFRFTHIAGQDYRHYIEATIFGLPIMKVNESYLDGRARMELPFGITENEPKIDQAANLGLWAESFWLPAILVTDGRVQWEPVDDVTAILVVPFDERQERFVVRFDPQNGMPLLTESMRFKEVTDEQKILWLNEVRAWGTLGEWQIMTVGTATWFDEGTPWAIFEVEEIVYNADVMEYVRAKGP